MSVKLSTLLKLIDLLSNLFHFLLLILNVLFQVQRSIRFRFSHRFPRFLIQPFLIQISFHLLLTLYLLFLLTFDQSCHFLAVIFFPDILLMLLFDNILVLQGLQPHLFVPNSSLCIHGIQSVDLTLVLAHFIHFIQYLKFLVGDVTSRLNL